MKTIFVTRVVVINGVQYPRNRVPMEFYDEWRKANPGVRAFFRGPRRPPKIKTGWNNKPMKAPRECLKADATHFYVGR